MLVVGGGSNLIAADAGFPGTVVHVATRGVDVLADDPDGVLLEVQAGHSWDELVAHTVARRLVFCVLVSMSSRVFLRFIQRGGIRDPLTALFTRKGVDDKMRRTDQALLHGGSGLDGDQFIHKGLVNTAAKLAQRLG